MGRRRAHPLLHISDINYVRENPLDYDRVVTVCQDSVVDNVGCAYEYYNLSDGETEGYGGEFSYTLFEQAAGGVQHSIERGEKTLIHCHMGQSRSVSVAAAAIAVHEDILFEEALEDCRSAEVEPDLGLQRFGRRFVNSHRQSARDRQ